ncbi:MAG: hypothetical protein JSR72_06590 [Proteobacteria bacterium]|nr:hypothetical protein [Pseudomonadota bacterium]
MNKKWLLCATTAALLVATPVLAANDATPGNDAAQRGGSVQHKDAAKGEKGAEKAIDKALKDRDASGQASDGASAKSADGDRSVNESRDGGPKSERAMAQRRLRQALKEAGFTDVRILGATYRIKARDEDGNTIFLRINPRSMNRHAMNKQDMHRQGMSGDDDMNDDDMAYDNTGRPDGREGMGRGGMHRGVMAEEGMDRAGVDRDTRQRGTDGETLNDSETAGEAGKAAGAGPMDRGDGGYGQRWGGRPSAYDRAYDQGFRDGYNRAFARAHGWR